MIVAVSLSLIILSHSMRSSQRKSPEGVSFVRIDHPLSPAEKYLSHNSLESDEMANLYSGNVTLDDSGRALVILPSWFQALNKDFRYQLTCVGGYSPVYIAKEITEQSF
ncbi:MAG: hypothetical protein ND866_22875 [Pyrinomonadaceae bacterium]|nr:hypothetical protein [Pyrinomonadaceae bacterium]